MKKTRSKIVTIYNDSHYYYLLIILLQHISTKTFVMFKAKKY